MSEDSKFYDHEHNLLAKNEEQFFDYLTSAEFDFHPVIKKRVFDVLYESGWYEGRNIDVIEFSKEMKQLGILLSQEQLVFLSEFSNIRFSFESEFCHFYSLEQILSKNKLKSTLLATSVDKTTEQNVLEIGETFSGPFHIDSKGILRFMGVHMMGRTAFECVNHLVKDVFEWDTEPDESEKMI